MISIKDKLINLFYEEDTEEVEIEVSPKVLKRRMILAVSIIINLILNVLYVSLFCYSGMTKYVGFIVFIFSFIWSIVSLISSYKLFCDNNNLLFYLNIFSILFVSKIWFVYF